MNRKLPRIFVDMDGVLVDFDGYASAHRLTPDQIKRQPGAYANMRPVPGALTAVHELADAGFEVWIATKPPTGVAFAYADKAAWVFQHLPEFSRRLILTHDKGLLGSASDYLVDDRPHRANCEAFPGRLIHFKGTPGEWERIVAYFRDVVEVRRRAGSYGVSRSFPGTASSTGRR